MQPKTIKAILRRKLDDWCKNISDEKIREIVRNDSIITGGAIYSLLAGEQPNDFDVYFKSKESVQAVAEYYVGLFKQNPPNRFKSDSSKTVDIKVLTTEDRVKIVVQSQGVASEGGTDNYSYFEQPQVDPSEPVEFVENIFEDKKSADEKVNQDTGEKLPKYRPIFLTSNAITLSEKVQIVIRFFGGTAQIHENFDFVHCMCSWDSKTGELILPPESLLSIINKRLKYTHSKYPLCSIIRTRKYLKLGWHIDAGQYVKMAWDLRKLNLTNLSVLEDQMVGVDSAYFQEVIALLNQKTENGTKPVEDSYLMEVIDRVFG